MAVRTASRRLVLSLRATPVTGHAGPSVAQPTTPDLHGHAPTVWGADIVEVRPTLSQHLSAEGAGARDPIIGTDRASRRMCPTGRLAAPPRTPTPMRSASASMSKPTARSQTATPTEATCKAADLFYAWTGWELLSWRSPVSTASVVV